MKKNQNELMISMSAMYKILCQNFYYRKYRLKKKGISVVAKEDSLYKSFKGAPLYI